MLLRPEVPSHGSTLETHGDIFKNATAGPHPQRFIVPRHQHVSEPPGDSNGHPGLGTID